MNVMLFAICSEEYNFNTNIYLLRVYARFLGLHFFCFFFVLRERLRFFFVTLRFFLNLFLDLLPPLVGLVGMAGEGPRDFFPRSTAWSFVAASSA
jgi:hypothetical protein